MEPITSLSMIEDESTVNDYLLRIHHFLWTEVNKNSPDGIHMSNHSISSNLDKTIQNLSLPGKKYQLIEEVISEAATHLTRRMWETKEKNRAGDILFDLSAEKSRRNLYGTLIQTARRR
jgi:hypothetical protein